jgi:hypothetical protein
MMATTMIITGKDDKYIITEKICKGRQHYYGKDGDSDMMMKIVW